MNDTLVRGTVWPMGSKQIEAGAQPCTDTWKMEPKYTDPGILIGNWYEQREQYRHKHEAKRQALCGIGRSQVPLNRSIYTTSYQNPKGIKSVLKLTKDHQQAMRAINPSLDASQYTAFKKYVNDVNSCPSGRSDKKVEDLCWYTTDHCQPCTALPALPTSNTLTTQQVNLPSDKLPRMSSIYVNTDKPIDIPAQIPEYKREKMAAPTKKPTTTTMRYRIAPDRGVYPLMEKALTENRHINKYTDRHCTTPTYAMRCLCDDCDLTEVAQVNQMNKWKTSVICTNPKAIPDLYKETHPVSYNKKINWITPNNRSGCHITCQ